MGLYSIFSSQTELLTGLPVTNVEEAKTAALKLLDQGCTKVIITLGGDGAVFVTSEDRDPVHIPTQKVTPVDTTVSTVFIYDLTEQILWG